nr:UDP-N-acetylglucosamine 2-epimerase (non-hydrolyzing) [Luteimonas sp. JM171]AOH36138.1 UDP-N-acetylglucosamine 2-epimerase [Luteimonas sp. JM171]
MLPKRVMVVFGTRPEAIKMAPVIRALQAAPEIETQVVVTAQHRHMLDQVLDLFGISPDEDLNLMQANQGLPDLFARIVTGMTEVITGSKPDLVLVHGDTSTTLATAMAAFYARVPVGHVEAGLRTGDMAAPWPEEMNRRLVAPLTSLHFAPTSRAHANLVSEGIHHSDVHVTGNTVVDALQHVVRRIETEPALAANLDAAFPFLEPSRRLILVTGHRRESFGEGFSRICKALERIAKLRDVQIVYPVHLNPNVQEPVRRLLGGQPNLHLIEPLDYLPFVRLMSQANLILTDSGGIQEEAPSLGKPVLVMRDISERPEAVEAGTALLVGTDPDHILAATARLLESPPTQAEMTNRSNPYGDGHAANRILQHIQRFLRSRAGASSAQPHHNTD